MDEIQNTLEKMRNHKAAGHKLIIAARERIRIPTTARDSAGVGFRIFRQATREEFIENAPNRKNALASAAPFYYEIEFAEEPDNSADFLRAWGGVQ